MDIKIRPATIKDVPAFTRVHRGENDPWADEKHCAAWVSRRLERGFYITAAEADGIVVGHAEWIVSREPDATFLYLGIVQIDAAYQHRGIGRAMLADGERYAREHGCAFVAAIPEEDNNSVEFYKKCGYTSGRTLYTATLDVHANPRAFTVESGVPESVISRQKFVCGLAQSSSRHMWEVANRKPENNARQTCAVQLDSGGWVQLSHFPDGGDGFAMCWSNAPDASCVETALNLAYMRGLARVEFTFSGEYAELFGGVETSVYNVEVVKML